MRHETDLNLDGNDVLAGALLSPDSLEHPRCFNFKTMQKVALT